MSFPLPALLLFVSSLISLGLSVFIFTRRRAPGATALGAIAVFISAWSAAYALEIGALDIQDKIFWAKMAYLGIPFVPFSWLLFTVAYTQGGKRRRWLKNIHFLAIVPLTTAALAFTNDWHNLIWTRFFIKDVLGHPLLFTEHGLWFWAHSAFSYLFILSGTALILISLWRRERNLYWMQSLALFISVLLPWIGNILFFTTGMGVDPTPFAFVFTVALLVWAIFGYRLTDIAPIARDMIVEGMQDGIVVLDARNRIVDINGAAARMIGLSVRDVIGQPIADALAPWPDVIARFRNMLEGDADFSVGQGELVRHYRVRFTLLTDSRGNPIGRLIHLRQLETSAPTAQVAAREPFTQPLHEAEASAPDAAAPPRSVLGWLQNFLIPEALDVSHMPGNMNTTWEQTIERTVTIVARFIMIFGSMAAYVVLSDLNFQDSLGYAIAVLSFLAGVSFVALARTAPFNFRVFLFLVLIYVMALTEMLKHGFSADVFVYFMALIVLSHMLLNLRGGMGMLTAVTATMILFAWSVLSGKFVPFEAGNRAGVVLPADLSSATTNIIGYFFSAMTMMTVVNMFIVNLNQAWKKETQALSLAQQERDLLELRVRERTAELRTYYQAIEQSGNSIVITDPQGNIEYVNPFFEKATGYSLGEALGQNPRILKSDNQSPEFYRNLWNVISSGEIWQGEFLNRRKDRSLYWELATIAPVKDEQGKIRHYVAIKEDITAQKQLRETLARQNEYLATLQTITLELLNRQNLDSLLNVVVERASQLLDAPLCEMMIKEGERMAVRAVTKDWLYLLGEKVSRAEAKLTWQAHDTRRPVILDDYAAWPGHREIYDRKPLHAVVNFPVVVANECIGALALGRVRENRPFTDSEIEYGQTLAQIAALVLDNLNLYESAVRELEERKRIQVELEVSEQEQRALASILQIGMSEDTLENTLLAALDNLLVVPWLSFEARGGIFLKDPQADVLALTVNRNLASQICALCQRVEFGKCHCGRAALTRRLQFSGHVDELHEIAYEGIPDHGHYNVPILSGKEVLGVVVLYLPPAYSYDERDARFLQAFAGVLSNIIRRKRTEELLRESEARFRQIVENAGDIIYRMDERGRMTYVNPVGLRLMGYADISEVLGKHFAEFAAPAWRSRVKAFYKRQALTGEQNTYYEFQALTKEGRQIWLGQNVQIIRLPDGKISFQSVARDITELKQTQQALEKARDQALEASHFKSQLVSRVSHELRTPLGGVLGYAELLYQGAFGALNEEQRDAAGNVVASANYLNIMINELLDQAQIEARAVKIYLAPFQPARLLENIRANMTILTLNKGLRFASELDPALPLELIGDERRLQQVLINLSGNAVKFTREGEVRVSLLKLDETHWAMRVADTGVGIPPEAREYIFESFRQVDNTITRDNRGTGLGLSITKQLVELMNGSLELESEVGRGSVFTVVLPLQLP